MFRIQALSVQSICSPTIVQTYSKPKIRNDEKKQVPIK